MASDQSGVVDQDSDSKQTTLVAASGPSITVNPPLADNHDDTELSRGEVSDFKDDDGDLEMPDADSTASHRVPPPVVAVEDSYPKTVPPPPPPPPAVPTVDQDSITVEEEKAVVAEQSQQKALLPPLEPRLKGRKCLVLDLDETLVHSSFKVSRLYPHGTLFRNSHVPDFTSSRFYDTR
jgi:RNA polymerase II subunit A small phosphatase-like protein